MNVNTNLTSTVKPSVGIKNNQVTGNCSFTFLESTFVFYVNGMVAQYLEEGHNVIYLSVSNAMQDKFNTFVAKYYAKAYSSPEQLRLTTLITSIWTKTKAFVDAKLTLSGDQNAIQEEMQRHQFASSQYTELAAQGQVGGKLFTARQARLLVRHIIPSYVLGF